ncbi:Anthranilate 1,2-dioxygenase system ferredoxin--NAD(+) reductase component [Listeria grayi]|uniref:Anthranilate 1,2-dioxygenase system ferredoxin--NAD(+) reductase component n=1 Tax=Listeria grayi TaxID=1641 RepID=A0A378MBD0_LISGR|nr:Anthranilate 1,2-dioxygenase system ferredoxin--NAD(+) reductase component [Listeria grayi]
MNTKKETRADIALETKVTAIDREAKQIELGSGEKIGYGQLLLATGGEPNRIKGEPSDRVIAFRTFADYRHLRKLVKEQKHFIVVGGGYIGTEIAAALVQNGAEVTLVVSDEKLGSSMFPDQLASEYHQTFEKMA